MKTSKCQGCKYYFITWDPARPYGCRAFGFKTKGSPWDVVKRSSGKECMMFTSKAGKGRPRATVGNVK